MTYRPKNLLDLWMNSDPKLLWENDKKVVGGGKDWREASESDEEDQSYLHLPHFMAVELDEPCCYNRDNSSTRSTYRPPRVQCTGDQPSFYQPKPVKATPTSLPPFRGNGIGSQNIWNPEAPLMTSTPRMSAFNHLPLHDTYSSIGELSSAPRAERTNSYLDSQASHRQPNYLNSFHGLRYAPYIMASGVTSASNTVDQIPVNRRKMVYLERFGGFGGNSGEFTEPSGVCVNPRTHEIVIADTNNHRVQVFDQHGNFKFMFGKCGRWDGQFMYPNRVAIDPNSESYVISERAPTHQIQIYDPRGRFLRRFGSDLLCNPRGLCVDRESRVVVVECKVMRIVIYDIHGRMLNLINCGNYLNFPNNVCVSLDHEIFISDNGDHCVKVFNYSGTFLRRIGGPGVTNYPIAVEINRLNQVVIVDNHNNFNVTAFSLDGRLVEAFESKVKHAQCLDAALTHDNAVIMCSKDFRAYIYRYGQNSMNEMMSKCQICGAKSGCGHQTPKQQGPFQSKDTENLTQSMYNLNVQPEPKNIQRLEIKATAEEDSEKLRRFYIEITIPEN